MLAGTVAAGLAQNQLSPSQTTLLSAEAPAPAVIGGEPTDVSSTSIAFTEFMKLVQASIEERVLLTFVTNNPDVFRLGVDQIVWLGDAGISKEVINAMLAHDLEVSSRQSSLAGPVLSTPPAPIRIMWPASWLASNAPTTTQPAKGPAPSPTPVALSTQPPLGVAQPLPAPSTRTSSTAAAGTADGIAGPGVSQVSVTGEEAQQADSSPSADSADRPSDYWRSPYPVRLPYPVKLLDPIVIMVRPR
jgi:hypothetical protein